MSVIAAHAKTEVDVQNRLRMLRSHTMRTDARVGQALLSAVKATAAST